ncbi:F-box/LRR-repeat protein At4g14103-like isoform X2 [Quercus robur]|uniref:F-box/LRR-repeat protein At4g14103-like isoform X2 n=1 Tax=Quercus robur TaxID=38942 RepID=UPI002162B345|nr:F-box/LRR-repeat protein At4g14103-like isoform X2 [Quercus robur]
MKGQTRESMEEEEEEEERRSEKQRIERAERAERRDVRAERRDLLLINVRARPCGCGGSSSNSLSSSSADYYKDIISSLPDCLLTHILSFLPTRASVATSILSNRWRSLWKLVPVLDLDQRLLFTRLDTDYPGPTRTNSNFSFLDAVSNIWALRNAIPLSKLRLHWTSNCDSFLVDTWVQDTLLRGGLQELDLYISTGPNPPLEMPTTLFFCSTLVSLILTGAILLNPPASASASTFPSLRILVIGGVQYAKHNSISTLLAACPVLQDLSLIVSTSNFSGLGECAGKVNVIVLIPTLKTLYVQWSADDCWLYKLQINTPALEWFRFVGGLGEDVVLENLPNLVEAVIELEDDDLNSVDYAKRVLDFSRPLLNVQSLKLSIEDAEIFCNPYEDGIPMFHNLSSLMFYGELHPDWFAWDVVLLMLCQAPKLQILAFKLTLEDQSYRSDFKRHYHLKEEFYVPECLSSHLTTFYYKGFSGHGIEMELVRYVLKEAKVLKTMKITIESNLGSKAKHRIHKKLMNFRRSSRTCQIEFDEGHLDLYPHAVLVL